MLAEMDEISMALAVLRYARCLGGSEILETQHDRIRRIPIARRGSRSRCRRSRQTPAEREDAFTRLLQVENRRREPWVVESLAYLNHPLRETHARRFIGPGLDLLREIQRTGDIFFPTRWTGAILSGHRSPEAAAIVLDFLGRELQYPQRLRWTILNAADELFRVAQ